MANFLSSIVGGISDALGGVIDNTIGLPFNLLSTGINASIDKHNQREMMRYSTQLQHDENLFWANYNSPAQQMQRLQEAGLNPNLVYGNGATATAGGSVTPSSKSPEYGKRQSGSELAVMRAQVRNLQAQNDNILAQNDNLRVQNEKTRAETRAIEVETRQRERTLDVDLHRGSAEDIGRIEFKISQERLRALEYENVHKVLSNDIQRLNRNILSKFGMNQAEADYISRQLSNSISQVDLRYAERDILSRLHVNAVQAKSLAVQASATAALKGMYEAQVDLYHQQTLTETNRTNQVYLDNELRELEKVVKQREADLADTGLFTNAPWYVNAVSASRAKAKQTLPPAGGLIYSNGPLDVFNFFK